MGDSGIFITWPLQYEYEQDLGDDGDPFPSLSEIHRSALQNRTAPAAQDAPGHPATDSSSSGDSSGNTLAAVVEKDGWLGSRSVGRTNSYRDVSWDFTPASPQQRVSEVTPSPATATARAHRSPPSRRKRTSPELEPEPDVEGHVMAERRRREKINRRFIELSAVIPGLKKMDKATILSDAVRYVKEQQEKLKAFEERNVNYGGCRTLPSTSAVAASLASRGSLPEIEARISESHDVMVRIHCEDGKGVLVRLLAAVEGLHLCITHNNVIPLPASTLNITIMAKVEKGFNVTPEDVVENLDAALHRRHRGK